MRRAPLRRRFGVKGGGGVCVAWGAGKHGSPAVVEAFPTAWARVRMVLPVSGLGKCKIVSR